ncbi:MAG: PCRF domain-containing protein [Planctomycetes bacterium]|nr:PCRF domain-containing protein [Planctomycetota bacterium]
MYSRFLELSSKVQTSPSQEDLKEYGKLSKFASLYENLKKIDKETKESEEIAGGNSELKDLAKEELERLKQSKREILYKIADYIDEGSDSSPTGVIIEIRPGIGGDEASLFAHDLFRSYIRFIEAHGWQHQIINAVYTEQKGIKYASLSIESEEACRYFKYEGGSHRVQRVPKTEASGRIHTSIATVAILEQVSEIQVDIKKEDLDIETKKAGGPGGQHVNKTESAVRIKHRPTGIVVECENDRSQQRNKDLALKLLRAKVYDHYEEKRKNEESQQRKLQIGSGERSEKIRTYNFTQNRITDHRINYSIHEIEKFLDGNLHLINDKLIEHEKEKKLERLIKG